jgi:hypothetical protein
MALCNPDIHLINLLFYPPLVQSSMHFASCCTVHTFATFVNDKRAM